MNEQPASPAPQPPVALPAAPKRPSKRQHESWRSIFSTIIVLLIAPAVALLLTAFVFQSYQVDGQSMETTLQNNDRLIVWKMPRTWARITGHPYIPNRGDIVIFNEQGLPDAAPGESKQLIKRVIGLPGDHVVIKNSTLTIYDKDHPDGFQPDKTMPYGKAITNTAGDIDLTVPANEVFVCGDNRPNSYDSRYFGPISVNNIVGKLAVRVLPLDKAERF